MWRDKKFEKIYNRYKEQVLFMDKSLTEEDLCSHYLDGEIFKNSQKYRKSELIAYERGVLKGIKMVDELLTPITLDPLEMPSIRFQIVILYAVDEQHFSKNLNELQEKYPNKKIFVGFGVEDILLKKEPDKFFFYKEEAEIEKKIKVSTK